MSSKLKQGKDKPLVPIADDGARLSIALPPATYDELVIFAKQYGLKKAKVQLEKGQDPTQVEINFRIYPKGITVRNEMDEDDAEMQDDVETPEEIIMQQEMMEEMTTQQYIVQSGDTLFFIAKRFNVTLDALKAANPQIANPELIFPGQIVMIPTQNLPPVPPNVFRYIVQPGDTLFFIARRFNVSLETLRLANPQITNPGLIFPGQIVFVPVTQMPPMPPGARQYIVQPGDTLEFISRRFGITVDEILSINPQITNKDLIFPGQVIFIPSMMAEQRCDDKDKHKDKNKDKNKDKKDKHKDKHKDKYNDKYKEDDKHKYGYEDKHHDDHYNHEKHEEECEEKVKEQVHYEEKCDEKEKDHEKYEYHKEEHKESKDEKCEPKKDDSYGDTEDKCEEYDQDAYPKKDDYEPENSKKESYNMEECETLNYFFYVIQSNDTLFEIARKFGVDLKELEEINPCITDPNKIYPGQIIKIPAKKYKKPVMTTKYVVQRGDTLFLIAEKFDINLAVLAAANPQIEDQNVIFPGQVINIPVTKMPPVDMSYFKYIVQPGDTLFVISQKFGIRLENMIRVNPGIINPDNIIPGQIVFVPTNKTMYKPAGTTEYVVQSGDTLFFIARRFGFMLSEVIAANPQIKNPDLIFPGQVINLPPCEMKEKCMEDTPPKG